MWCYLQVLRIVAEMCCSDTMGLTLGRAAASGRRTGRAMKMRWLSATGVLRVAEVCNHSRSCCKGGLSLLWGGCAEGIQTHRGLPEVL